MNCKINSNYFVGFCILKFIWVGLSEGSREPAAITLPDRILTGTTGQCWNPNAEELREDHGTMVLMTQLTTTAVWTTGKWRWSKAKWIGIDLWSAVVIIMVSYEICIIDRLPRREMTSHSEIRGFQASRGYLPMATVTVLTKCTLWIIIIIIMKAKFSPNVIYITETVVLLLSEVPFLTQRMCSYLNVR